MFESRLALHSNYVPNCFELQHLARIWWHEYYDVHFYCYVCNQVGGTELQLMQFAAERLKMLKGELGIESWEEIAIESEKRYGESRPDQDTWQMFLKGEALGESLLES